VLFYGHGKIGAEMIRNKIRKKAEVQAEQRFILAIDGGGMRGIVPAVLLSKLAESLKGKGDTLPFYAHFDLIAGTSTGGLLALALGAPSSLVNIKAEEGNNVLLTYPTKPLSWWAKLAGKKSAQQKEPLVIARGCDPAALVDLYASNGPRIFPKQNRRIFGQVLREKYDERDLVSFLDDTFRLSMMEDCLVPTMVTTYDVRNGEPYCFTSWNNKGYFIKEAARATSAAPTYFAPFEIKDHDSGQRRSFVDGGIIANNPTLAAYAEARKLYPDCTLFHIISLSTATIEFKLDSLDLGGGVIGWIDPAKGAPMQKIYAASQMQLVDQIASQLPDVTYTRLNLNISADDRIKMDDTSFQSIDKLKNYGISIFNNQQEEIEKYLNLLTERTDFSQVRQPQVNAIDDAELLRKRKEESDRLKRLEDERRKEEEKKQENAIQENETKTNIPVAKSIGTHTAKPGRFSFSHLLQNFKSGNKDAGTATALPLPPSDDSKNKIDSPQQAEALPSPDYQELLKSYGLSDDEGEN
jgi:patatin-like phospholipase/acyl hydrolase